VERHPQCAATLGVDEEEAAGWRDAAAKMIIPYDEALGVHPQSEGFTEHQRWDFEHCAPETYPLLLHYPYFDLYRKQVVKQADLVYALFICGDSFTAEEKLRNFDYYEPLTVRDSSLSACCQAVVAAEVGHLDLAYDYFAEAALMDLEDLEHNTRDGIHIASVAGTWIAAVCGFGVLRGYGDELHLSPRLPPDLTRLKFRLMFRGSFLHVEVNADHARYWLLDGHSLDIHHHGESVTVEPDRTVEMPIPRLPPRPAPSQPPGRAPVRRHPPAGLRSFASDGQG
jgi:alpha,alpha-trehalose phosphorylase